MPHPLQNGSTPTPFGYRDVTVSAAGPHLAIARVIDVREPDEYVGPLGHIAGAELVPLTTIPDAASGWDRAATYVIVCRSGARSGRAAAWMASAGFTDVYNLAGGMMGWNDAGLPVAR
jgi:rhodanese-related sulfurtransferase